MFKMRPEHVDAFIKDGARRFENELLQRLRQQFPQKCDLLNENVLREEIRYAIQRARSYGITAERDICLYADVAFALGRDFDRDPTCPWAQRILNSREPASPSARIDWLHSLAMRPTGQGA
jgi:hypothetical protein